MELLLVPLDWEELEVLAEALDMEGWASAGKSVALEALIPVTMLEVLVLELEELGITAWTRSAIWVTTTTMELVSLHLEELGLLVTSEAFIRFKEFRMWTALPFHPLPQFPAATLEVSWHSHKAFPRLSVRPLCISLDLP